MFLNSHYQPAQVHFMCHPNSRHAHLANKMQRLAAAQQSRRHEATNTFRTQYINEQDDKVELSIDIPGVSQSDLNVSVENHVLTISGTRQSSGWRFSRQFALDANVVDADNLSANLVDGVLTITAPKMTRSGPMQVTVSEEPAESSKANENLRHQASEPKADLVLDNPKGDSNSPLEEDDGVVMVETVDDDDVMVEANDDTARV